MPTQSVFGKEKFPEPGYRGQASGIMSQGKVAERRREDKAAQSGQGETVKGSVHPAKESEFTLKAQGRQKKCHVREETKSNLAFRKIT